MKNKTILILFTTIISAGCYTSLNNSNSEPVPVEKTARIIEAGNNFSFELYRNIYNSEKEDKNIMVSPLSVSLALAMTYNGADGETKEAMEKTLKVYGLTPEEINNTYYQLLRTLKSLDPKVLLEIANAIFYRNDFQVEKDFIAVNKKYYDAEVSPLDFASEQATETINGWVADKTHDKIENIIEQITPDQVMFLLNAIYFKGMWQKEFNEKSTQELTFYPEKGESFNTEMMQRLDTLPYTKNDLFSAIELSYGKGSYNMYVFLPGDEKTVKDITNELNEKNWKNWLESFTITKNVDIKLPRFKYEYEITLNDVLSQMGMGIAFSGSKADFSGISKKDNLFIDYVKHKSFIEVNEEGTEAAAVTVVAIARTSLAPRPQKIPFIVNKPFMYAITEKSTGAILFMGTVNNPQKN